jgi:predicted RNA binding protein YcfA (HicA-like mRNA interferase family)/cell fate (sporulation/competence/biofilm development) regulator YmcA (YheA/YmcA/DUF963 family)
MHRDVKDFIRFLKGRGWTLERKTGSGHIKMTYARGGHTILPMTPSDNRWLLNAQSDARKVEQQYGPWVPPKKEAPSDRGLNFQKQTWEETDMKLKTFAELPRVVEPEQMKITTPAHINTKAIPNNNLIMNLLQKRKSELLEIVSPHLEAFKEFQQIEEILTQYSSSRTVEEKVQEFKQIRKPTVSAKRFKLKEFYQLVRDVVKTHNGEINIKELSAWMEDVHGVKGSANETVRGKIVRNLHKYNEENPGRGDLVLSPIPSEGMRPKYDSVCLREIHQ